MRETRVLPFALLGAVALVAVGVGAYLLYPALVPATGRVPLPSAGDALLRVPVWVGDRDGLRLVLMPQDPGSEADRADDALLASHLFPDAPETRFVVLRVYQYGEAGDVVLDRSGIVLRDGDGRERRPPDLPAALAGASLRPGLLLALRLLQAAESRIVVPPRSYRRVLVALPEGLAPEEIRGVEALGVALARREVVRNRLEDFLADPGDEGSLLEGAR